MCMCRYIDNKYATHALIGFISVVQKDDKTLKSSHIQSGLKNLCHM